MRRTDTIFAVGPATGGVGDVFAGAVNALRESRRAVIDERLEDRGSSLLVAARVAYRRRRTLKAAAVVHVEFGSNDVAVFWFAFIATVMRADTVLVIHDPDVVAHAPGARVIPVSGRWSARIAHRALSPLIDGMAIRRLLRHAGSIVVLGESARAELVARSRRPVVSVPHGADKSERRRRPPSECDYFLFAGYLGPHKGIEMLLDAWATAGQHGLRLVIVGGAGQGDVDWANSLMARARLLPSPPEWIGHVEAEDDFQAWIDGAAAVVLPYQRSSPASGILVRAMTAGRCVVATRVDAVTEAVEDGISGALVDARDAEGLASRLIDLAVNGIERDRLGVGAEQRAEEFYGWTQFVEGMQNAYELAAVR